MSTGPVPLMRDEPEAHDEIPFASFNLVELDDAGVAKDFTQSGAFVVPPPPAPPTRQPRLVTNGDNDLPIEIPKGRAPTAPPRYPTLREALAELERAKSSDDATEAAMAFAMGRWESSLLFMIKEGAALGHRGHGPNLSAATVGAVAVPLVAPSIVAVAHASKRLAVALPHGAGAVQNRLANLLGLPDAHVAAPIIVGDKVAAIFTVGDPQGDPIGTDRAELDKLCTALGAAYARVIASKRT
jgi:hypothetical protein